MGGAGGAGQGRVRPVGGTGAIGAPRAPRRCRGVRGVRRAAVSGAFDAAVVMDDCDNVIGARHGDLDDLVAVEA